MAPAWGIAMFLTGAVMSAFGASERKKQAKKEQKKYMAHQRRERLRREGTRSRAYGQLMGDMSSAARSYSRGNTPWGGQ